MSSNNLDKYENLAGDDLGLKPSTFEQAKFECSSLGKIFNKELSEDNKKEGLFKRLENIKNKNEEQLQVIQDQSKKQLDAIKDINISSKPLRIIDFFSTISEKAKKKKMNEIKLMDDWLDTAQLVCTKTDGKTKYEFNKFTFPSKFTLKIYCHDFTLQEAEDDQQKLQILINKISNNYNPLNETKKQEKEDTLKSAKKLFFIREDIIRAFKNGTFPYIDGFKVKRNQMKMKK